MDLSPLLFINLTAVKCEMATADWSCGGNVLRFVNITFEEEKKKEPESMVSAEVSESWCVPLLANISLRLTYSKVIRLLTVD